ncbi:hypothetical protein BZG36_02480 [Bifiguratus adelaidae]|uniref:7-dehydrocholesterol reductase n=1 Tax=Bifiguratus adelaidae TaxID=1938954 RepID=A0A261Y0X0_9FUNG|nr:hypothetical protein BZG36_02480 [Bifiguratus adelaidae]
MADYVDQRDKRNSANGPNDVKGAEGPRGTVPEGLLPGQTLVPKRPSPPSDAVGQQKPPPGPGGALGKNPGLSIDPSKGKGAEIVVPVSQIPPPTLPSNPPGSYLTDAPTSRLPEWYTLLTGTEEGKIFSTASSLDQEDITNPTVPVELTKAAIATPATPTSRKLTLSAFQKKQPDFLAEFIPEKFYGQWWFNAAGLSVAIILTSILAYFGAGLGTCLFISILFGTYYQTSIRARRANVRSEVQATAAKPPLDTDYETVDWINTLMQKLWIIVEPWVCAQIVLNVDRLIEDQRPGFIDVINLRTITLGTKPPRINYVKTYRNTDADVVAMDWRVSLTPNDVLDRTPLDLKTRVNPKFVVTAQVGKGYLGSLGVIPVVVEDIAFEAFVRIRMKLMPQFPHCKNVDISLLEPPVWDFKCRPIGGQTFGYDITNIPGLMPLIRDQVFSILRPMMFDPNVFTVDIEELMTGGKLKDSAIGVLAVTLYSAQGLKGSDSFGSIDPYVTFHVNNRGELARTSVKNDTTSPKWNETKLLLIKSLNDTLNLQVMDRNTNRKDSTIGQADFDLKQLQEDPDGFLEGINLPILRKGKTVGETKLDLRWYPVSMPKKDEDGTVEKPAEFDSGILRLTLGGCKDLETKSGLLSSNSPYARVLIDNKEVFVSDRQNRTNNPTWAKTMEFIVTDKVNSNLKVEIRDSEGGASLYTWNVQINDFLEAVSQKQDWFALGNNTRAKLNISAMWKSVPIVGGGAGMGHGGYVPPIGVVRIKFFAARDIKNVEAMHGGKSDPYMRVLSGIQIRARTEVIDNDLNPVWEEAVFVPIHSVREALVLECMDWNAHEKHKTLGMVELDMKTLVKEVSEGEGKLKTKYYQPGERIERYVSKRDQQPQIIKNIICSWQPLRSADRKSVKGELHYSAEFFPTLQAAKQLDEKEEKEKAEAEAKAKAEAQKKEKQKSQDAKEQVLVEPTKPLRPRDVDMHGEKFPLTEFGDVDILKYQSGVFSIIMHEAIFKQNLKAVAEIFVDAVDAQSKSATLTGTRMEIGESSDAFVRELDFSRVIIQFRKSRENDEEADTYYSQWGASVKDIVRRNAERQQEIRKQPDAVSLDEKDEGEWYQLNGKYPGRIRLSFKYTPVIRFQLDPADSMENQGQLTVTMISASDLLAADRNGKSDPFVTFSLNGQRVHKSEVYKKTLNPVFKEPPFTVPVPSRTKAKFIARVYDWDQVSHPDDLGETIIPLEGDNVISFQSLEKEFALTRGGEPAGRIKLRFMWKPELLARKKEGTSIGGALAGAPGAVIGAGFGAGKAIVGESAHLAGEGLALGAKGVGAGFHVAGEGLHLGAKGVGAGVGVGAKAVGGGAHLLGSGLKAGGGALTSGFHLRRSPSKDLNGGAAVQDPTQQTIAVDSSGNPINAMGQVQPEKNPNPTPSQSTSSNPGLAAPVNAAGAPRAGTLAITIVSAQGLTAMDKGGTSDPLVKVKSGSKNLHKTKTIKKTLSPEWNETFTVHVTPDQAPIEFDVRDHNTFGGDDDIGVAKINIWDHLTNSTSYESDIPLTPNGSGTIHVLDPGMLIVTFPHRRIPHFWAMKKFFDVPVLGWIFRSAGVVPVDTKTKQNAALFQSTFEVLQRGGVVALFPEGTSYTEPHLLPLKDGLAWAAYEFAHHAESRPSFQKSPELETMTMNERSLSEDYEDMAIGGHTEQRKPDGEDTCNTTLRYREAANASKNFDKDHNQHKNGEPRVTIVPVGITYTDKTKWRSDAIVEYGSPIRIYESSREQFEKDPKGTVKALTARVEKALLDMTINADDKETFEAASVARRLLFDRKGSLPNKFFVKATQTLADLFSAQRCQDRPNLRQLKTNLLKFTQTLYELRLTHTDIQHLQHKKLTGPRAFLRFLGEAAKFLFNLPLFLPGLIFHLPIYAMGKLSEYFEKYPESIAQDKVVMTAAMAPILYGLLFRYGWKATGFTVPGFFMSCVFIPTFAWYHMALLDSRYDMFKTLNGKTWGRDRDAFKANSAGIPISTLLASKMPYATFDGFKIWFLWLGFQAVLYMLLPAKIGYGQRTPAGYLLPYKVNGLLAWAVSHISWFIGFYYLGLWDSAIVHNHWGALLVVANIYGYALTFFAFVKAYLFPSHPEDRKFSGSWIYDMLMGIEMNPRFGKMFDFKLFHNGRPGIVAWTLIDLSFAAAQYQQIGYITNSMILVNVLHAVYVIDFFYNEDWYLRTIDIAHDHFGFYLAWGDSVWLPFMYTLQSHYLVRNPIDLSWPYFTLVAVMGMSGYWIFRTVNNQKDLCRRSDGKCKIWGKPARVIRTEYETSDGKTHRSLLLASGFWGLSRHFNYVGDLLLSTAMCWSCGFGHLLPHFYAIFMTILLLHRIQRDDARCRGKYGKYWEEYGRLVPYKLLPYVY